MVNACFQYTSDVDAIFDVKLICDDPLNLTVSTYVSSCLTVILNVARFCALASSCALGFRILLELSECDYMPTYRHSSTIVDINVSSDYRFSFHLISEVQ